MKKSFYIFAIVFIATTCSKDSGVDPDPEGKVAITRTALWQKK